MLNRTIQEKDFRELLKYSGEDLISLYIPTHRFGKEVMEKKDKIQLKSCIKEIEKSLLKKGLSEEDVGERIEGMYELYNDSEIWRHQSESFVIFSGEKFFRYFSLPTTTETFWYIGANFYLKPIIPLYEDNGQFYLLGISQGNIRLFECSRFGKSEIPLKGIIPANMEEALKYDNPERSLQFHTGVQSNADSPVYHGHGKMKENDKKDIKRYFDKVCKKLEDFLEHRQIPMVLAGIDYEVGHFKHSSNYPAIVSDFINANPEGVSIEDLHKQAYELARNDISKEQNKALDRYHQLAGTQKTTQDIRDVIKRSYYKQIDTLFLLDSKQDIWGNFDYERGNLRISKDGKEEDRKLLNIAAINTLNYGGHVFVMHSKENMPTHNTMAAAILRTNQ